MYIRFRMIVFGGNFSTGNSEKIAIRFDPLSKGFDIVEHRVSHKAIRVDFNSVKQGSCWRFKG